MPQAASKQKTPELPRLSDEEAESGLAEFMSGSTRRLTDEEALASLGEHIRAPEKPGLFGAAVGSFLEGISSLAGEADIVSEYMKSENFQRGMSAGSTDEELAAQDARYRGTPEEEAASAAKPGPFKRMESGLKAGGEAMYPPEQRGQGGLPEQLASGVGSIGAGVTGMLAGPVGAAIQFGAMTGVPLYYEVLDKTGSKESATFALLFGNAVGQLEKFGAEKALGSTIKKLASKGFSEALEKAAIATAAKGALSETATEVAQQALTDAVQEHLTGEDLDNIARMKAVIPPSLILGGAFGLLDGAVSRGRPQASQEAPGAPPAPQAAQEAFSDEPRPQAAPVRTVVDISEATAPGAERPAATEEGPPPPAAAVEPEVGAPEPVATTTPEPQAQPTVPAPEQEVGKTTGIKRATIEKELTDMGLPLPEKAERRGFVEVHAEAMAEMEANRDAGKDLVAELAAEPRSLTDKDDALLTFEANRLVRARDKAEAAYDADPTAANKAKVDKIQEEYAATYDAIKGSKTETARGLNAMKMMVARDYSLAAVEHAVREAKGGEALTPKESAKVKELVKELEATRLAHEKYASEAEIRRAQLEADNAILKMKKDVGSFKKRKERKTRIEQTKKEIGEILDRMGERARNKAAAGLGGLDAQTLKDLALVAGKTLKLGGQTLAQFTDAMVARLGEGIRPYIQPAWEQAQKEHQGELVAPVKAKLAAGKPLAEAGSDIQKIAESFVAHGVHEREKLIDAVHEVIKQADPNVSRNDVRDAISGYGVFRKLSKDETKKKLRELKGEMREVAKLEALSQGTKPEQTGFERRKPTQQELKLNDKTRQLMKQLGFTKKPGKRWTVGTANEVAVEAKKLASKIKSRKTRLENQIADLNERIKNKDFGPKPKVETPLDAQAIKLKATHEEARRKFEREKERHRFANRTTTQKVLGGVKEILIDLPRAIKSAFDVSAPFRQGVIFTVGHPIKSIKNVGRMFQALASERKALEIDTELRSRPLAEFGERSKLELTRLDDDITRPGEEAIQSKWSSKIPGIKASNRAFVTYLNLQRAQNFDLMVRALPDDPTMADGKAIAKFVNIATGRGDFGRFAGAAEGASLILWSPRLLLSRLQLMTGAGILYKGGRAAVRKQVAKEYARFLIGMSAFYTVARMAQDAWGEDEVSVEEDPRSSDFGKLKIGNTRIDPLGGLAQVLTLTGRTISGETKTGKGEVRDLVDPKFGQDDLTDVYKRFARSKLTPFLGTIVDLRTGENIVGEKVTPGKAAAEFATPLSFNDIRKAMEEQGVPKGAAMGILALFGMGLQTYDSERKRDKK